ncbi:MAG: TrkA family potassium uptake protein [Nitrospirota bacterium]|nr:TrkA family potassium uptake protein [Nitrospirota bacterium]
MRQTRTFAVIGLGRFGAAVAETLVEQGLEVLAIDNDGDKVDQMSDRVTHAVQCDATDERALRAVGIENVDVAVVSIGEGIEASILIVMTLMDMGVPEVIAKAVTVKQGKVLEKLGVARVVYPEREAAVRLAHGLAIPNQLEHLELAKGFALVEMPLPSRYGGMLLRETMIRSRYDVNVVAIKRAPDPITGQQPGGQEEVNFQPAPDDLLRDGDVLLVIGHETDLKRLQEEA